MYLIHLIGSHSKYTTRYPKNITLFKNTTTIQEEYDNSIFYTDYILKNIFYYFKNKFQNKKILFVYISDHGEVVNKDKNGHGFLPPFKDEYEAPFILYRTIKNNRINELYQSNKKGYFNLENLNYIVEYISGMRNNARISYSNKVFALEPKYIFNYDKLDFYKK